MKWVVVISIQWYQEGALLTISPPPSPNTPPVSLVIMSVIRHNPDQPITSTTILVTAEL